jgi:peptide deformylase
MTKQNLIVGREAPILREVARPVSLEEIKSKKFQALLQKMKKALHGEEDGVAIAAPQIGESLRVFVVSGRALVAIATDRKIEEVDEGLSDIVFINPEIIKLSQKKKKMEEGCLSVRWLYGQVKRSEKATVRAYDENGVLFTKGASGILAQIFQHEVDHLNGILFIDKAENVEDLPPKLDDERK